MNRELHFRRFGFWLACACLLLGLRVEVSAAGPWLHNQDFPFSKPGNSPAVYHNNQFVILSAEHGVWSSQDGATWNCIQPKPAWAPRTDHVAVSFMGKLWVMGGRNAYSYSRDVWSSLDGIEWTREADAPWSERASSSAVVYNNKLLLFGGVKMTVYEEEITSRPMIAYNYFNELWSTGDGSTWEQTTVPWAGRALPATVAHDGKLWMLGGAGATELNDVWVSTNGTSWSLQNGAAPWGQDWSLSAFSYGNRIRVACGISGLIWHSDNSGRTWTQMAAPVQWPPMWGQSAVTAGDQFYMLSGAEFTTNTLISKVWRSTDAVKWMPVGSEQQLWSPRFNHRALNFKGRIWVTGGIAQSTEITSLTGEVWRSYIQPTQNAGFYTLSGWIPMNRAAPWGARWGHGILRFGDEMFLFGGCDDVRAYGDVWSSPDGTSWTLATNNAWPKRSFFASTVYKGRMWVIGGTGRPESTTETADVYYSINGTDWVKTADPAPFRARMGMGAADFDGKLWVIGGSYQDNGRQYPSEAWSTTDGVNWKLETDALPFARQDFATAVCAGRLWVLGGANGATLYNDVWSSADGVNWESEGNAPWSPRRGMAVAFFNNTSLWIMGGYANGALNDVWMLPFRSGTERAWLRMQ